MELPHIGQNCALKQCNQLDFLPVKCDACCQVFCLQHYQYERHSCEKAKNRNVQVPVCPLCSEPVVGNKRTGELPDVAVSQHIDQYCKRNESANRIRSKSSNLQACTFKSCKQKDVIYLECNDCRSKFCIKHRHPSDHSCPGPSFSNNIAGNWQSFKDSCSTSASSSFGIFKNKAQQISKSGQAALHRLGGGGGGVSSGRSGASRNSSTRQPTIGSRGNGTVVTSLQGNLSEQEALAIALNESRGNQQSMPINQAQRQHEETEDEALARAIHESQLEATRNRAASSKDSCVLS